MNREETAELIKTLQHFVDDGEVECQDIDSLTTNWSLISDPVWDFNKVKYRPHKRFGDCWVYLDREGYIVALHGKPPTAGAFQVKWEEMSESG